MNTTLVITLMGGYLLDTSSQENEEQMRETVEREALRRYQRGETDYPEIYFPAQSGVKEVKYMGVTYTHVFKRRPKWARLGLRVGLHQKMM